MRSLSFLVVCAAFLLTHWNFVSTEDYKPMRSEVDPDACKKWDYHPRRGPGMHFGRILGVQNGKSTVRRCKKYTKEQLDVGFKRLCVALPRLGWEYEIALQDGRVVLTPEEEALVAPLPISSSKQYTPLPEVPELFWKQEGPLARYRLTYPYVEYFKK